MREVSCVDLAPHVGHKVIVGIFAGSPVIECVECHEILVSLGVDLSREVWGTVWSWQDVVDSLGELECVFLELPLEKKKELMDRFERSIAKYLEDGVANDWMSVMQDAIYYSGLQHELESLMTGGVVENAELVPE